MQTSNHEMQTSNGVMQTSNGVMQNKICGGKTISSEGVF